MAKAKGIPLTADLVKRLKLDAKPSGLDAKGKMILEPNPDGKEYFVFCSDQNSPKGCALRPSPAKKPGSSSVEWATESSDQKSETARTGH